MTSVKLTARCFGKMMMHAVKYPSSAISGLLLADPKKPNVFLDAVPLFHHSHNLTPPAEFALTHIDNAAEKVGLAIVGFYAAGENFYDNTIEKMPGLRIADKIAENFPLAYFLMIDNKSITLNPSDDLSQHCLKFSQSHDGRWKTKDPSLIEFDENAQDCIYNMLANGAYKLLVDYDNHLDDIAKDWTNAEVNKQIDQLMEMYA